MFWISQLDDVLDEVDSEPNSSGAVTGSGYLTEGNHVVTLAVVDPDGREGTASVPIGIGAPNEAPLCTIDNPLDGAAGGEYDEVHFVGMVSDETLSSSNLTITWTSDKDGELSTAGHRNRHGEHRRAGAVGRSRGLLRAPVHRHPRHHA